jgi:hypothetical protein
MSEPLNKLKIDLDFLDNKEPVRVAPKLEDKTVAIDDKPKTSTVSTVRPWVRFWARYLDIGVFSILLGIFLAMSAPSMLENSTIVLNIFVYFIWIFAESVLLSSWGTTPGKWLLKIDIKKNNNKPDFSSALNRSFTVWLRGMGLGIPIISLFTLISSYNFLNKEGVTFWDKNGSFTMTHRKIGVFRIIGAASISLIIILLIFSD